MSGYEVTFVWSLSLFFLSSFYLASQVLLVGNMGLYDYRPYVKKVKNNRQIMFECGRGYKLADGPPGATCIDGRSVQITSLLLGFDQYILYLLKLHFT